MAALNLSKVVVAICCGGLMACASADSIGDKAVFQSFEFGTSGQGAIDKIHIDYGNFKIPTLHDPHFEAHHHFFFSETMTIPVPESIKIHWASEDGQSHDVVASVRSFIHDTSIFYGFRFVFVDDHVDIYLIDKIKSPSPYVDVKRTKVFSSSQLSGQ